MATLIRTALLAVFFLLSACATPRSLSGGEAPTALPADGPVSVSWEDPAGFSERHRRQGSGLRLEPDDWMLQLASYFRRSVAARLDQGQQVSIHIEDVALAGAYEFHGATLDDVRVLRDIYPPNIELRLDRIAADGSVQSQTPHRLRDLGYLSRQVIRHGRDFLQHEKLMIDDWVAREFPVAR